VGEVSNGLTFPIVRPILGLLVNQLIAGKPPALLGDSQSLTFAGVVICPVMGSFSPCRRRLG